MMKNICLSRRTLAAVLFAAFCCLLLPACASAYDAGAAGVWLEQFATALSSMEPLNRPQDTADPARAGQVLIEYPFGTVTAKSAGKVRADEITGIDVRSAQVTDCRGVRVGMGLDAALGGATVGASSTQLYVLDTQEDGYGWAWAYVNADGVYGVEYITYQADTAAAKEYTLTYVIEQGVISAIRMRIADATQAQAMDGLKTAQEIAGRQHGEVLAAANQATMLTSSDLQVNGVRALGADVASVASRLGQPVEIQTLPEGTGRILLYDGAVIFLRLDEYTGVERVSGVSVSTAGLKGPRGLTVGMPVQAAAALFACEQDVSSLGGTLYLAGEAMGEAPYGELIVRGAEAVLRYACIAEDGREAVLEAGVQNGEVAYWRMVYAGEADDAEGGV